jgi:hydrogenase-4 component E
MNLLTDILIIIVLLANFRLISSSRLRTCVQVVAVQALVLSALPLIAEPGTLTLHLTIVAILSALIKGLLMPWLLIRAIKEAEVRRETEPIIGYISSLLLGIGMLAAAFWLSGHLIIPGAEKNSLLVPLAMFTIISGLFMIVARKKALTQVVGYLMLENGIYAFGLAFAHREPLVVELGILLDIFAAALVMGIAIFHINREFDSIDTELLTQLKD